VKSVCSDYSMVVTSSGKIARNVITLSESQNQDILIGSLFLIVYFHNCLTCLTIKSDVVTKEELLTAGSKT